MIALLNLGFTLSHGLAKMDIARAGEFSQSHGIAFTNIQHFISVQLESTRVMSYCMPLCRQLLLDVVILVTFRQNFNSNKTQLNPSKSHSLIVDCRICP